MSHLPSTATVPWYSDSSLYTCCLDSVHKCMLNDMQYRDQKNYSMGTPFKKSQKKCKAQAY